MNAATISSVYRLTIIHAQENFQVGVVSAREPKRTTVCPSTHAPTSEVLRSGCRLHRANAMAGAENNIAITDLRATCNTSYADVVTLRTSFDIVKVSQDRDRGFLRN